MRPIYYRLYDTTCIRSWIKLSPVDPCSAIDAPCKAFIGNPFNRNRRLQDGRRGANSCLDEKMNFRPLT